MIQLPSSKSISNRLLIMQAMAESKFEIENLSTADDTTILHAALKSKSQVLDLGMAGTAFRFLTAYCSIQNETRVLTGHQRMKERPIAPLVLALKELGCEINYLEKEGFPPLEIRGTKLLHKQISLEASISSQFVSALLMIAPYCQGGLEITMQGELVSEPYITMTLNLMSQLSISTIRKNNGIKVFEGVYQCSKPMRVEADWSSAAFFYQYFACSNLKTLQIAGLQVNSIQGDSKLSSIFELLGLRTSQTEWGVSLSKVECNTKAITFDLIETPDLVPSVAIAAALLKETCIISGVKTLRIKESNRVLALKNELAKINIEVLDLDENRIQLTKLGTLPNSVYFKTYNDHRMAMSLAMLKARIPEIELEQKEVVSKSFPNFWEELENCLKADKVN